VLLLLPERKIKLAVESKMILKYSPEEIIISAQIK